MLESKAPSCFYAIIRFAPFPETGEFANVGLLLICPDFGFFDYRLEKRRLARVTRFFEPMDASLLREAIHGLEIELQRMKREVGHVRLGQHRLRFGDSDPAEILFEEMVRRREGLLRFSKVRSRLSKDPSHELDALFSFYVRKSFVTQEYRERAMEKAVKSALHLHDLDGNFKPREFDDGVYRKKFPFVQEHKNKVRRIIKPLFLGQERPSAIIDHAHTWSMTLKRFRVSGQISGEVLFPIERPSASTNRQERAFVEARGLLLEANAKTVEFEDEDKIISFASAA